MGWDGGTRCFFSFLFCLFPYAFLRSNPSFNQSVIFGKVVHGKERERGRGRKVPMKRLVGSSPRWVRGANILASSKKGGERNKSGSDESTGRGGR